LVDWGEHAINNRCWFPLVQHNPDSSKRGANLQSRVESNRSGEAALSHLLLLHLLPLHLVLSHLLLSHLLLLHLLLSHLLLSHLLLLHLLLLHLLPLHLVRCTVATSKRLRSASLGRAVGVGRTGAGVLEGA
jgi:hypothetical protein